MYVHISVSPEDAKRLFDEFARKPLKPGECGVATGPTFEAHFAEYLQTYLPMIGANLEIVRSEGLFVLKFDHYLAHLPAELISMEVMVVKAEIVRFNSAPTKARAGYYENPPKGFVATVERVFPSQQTNSRFLRVPLYAQNIRVVGPTLAAVQEFNSQLSMGHYNRFLVNAFE